LIIRPDEIGDYMLWRNFIPELAESDVLKGYEIHFCGNVTCKDLFEIEDAKYFQQTTWLQKTRFKKELGYRYRFLRKAYSENYTIVINPVYSRAKRVDDAIIKATKARQVIGMMRNNENYASYEMKFDKYLYTRLMPEILSKPVFEFYRNKQFTEFITAKKSLVEKISINTDSISSTLLNTLPEKYFVVFPGSRNTFRIWPAEKFVAVSNYLFDSFGWTVVICGSAGDAGYTAAFVQQYQHDCIDLTGNTSLPEMLLVLQKARCLLSVDTGSVHLAAAVGCTVFGIYNGSQYGRFAPYPKEIADHFFSVYPDEVDEEINDTSLIKARYEYVVNVPYNRVSTEKVIKVINQYFNSSSI